MKFIKANLLVLTLLAPIMGYANEWSAVAVRIEDGDTMVVVNQNAKYIKIRLINIDAPDLKQAFGEKSKQSLSEMCLLKPAVIEDKGFDKHKLTLAKVKCNNLDASEEQVKRGMAWAEPDNQTDQTIKDLAEKAKASKIGLWQDSEPVSPWDFHPDKNVKTKN